MRARFRFLGGEPSIIAVMQTQKDGAESDGALRHRLLQRRRAKVNRLTKDLVLIPDSEESLVPTHAARLELEAQGMIIHEFPFDREWDATTLRRNIEKEFPVLESRSFEFVKVGKTCVRWIVDDRDGSYTLYFGDVVHAVYFILF